MSEGSVTYSEPSERTQITEILVFLSSFACLMRVMGSRARIRSPAIPKSTAMYVGMVAIFLPLQVPVMGASSA